MLKIGFGLSTFFWKSAPVGIDKHTSKLIQVACIFYCHFLSKSSITIVRKYHSSNKYSVLPSIWYSAKHFDHTLGYMYYCTRLMAVDFDVFFTFIIHAIIMANMGKIVRQIHVSWLIRLVGCHSCSFLWKSTSRKLLGYSQTKRFDPILANNKKPRRKPL